MEVRNDRKKRGIVATFKAVDTCAAEFEAYTPYYYSTYEDEDETPPKDEYKKRVIILGGGPNRIGQGIEFDYCCCQASFAMREMGIESIMVNSNPETVSTDYDTSDLPLFRAADDRRRAEHLRPRETRRRDRAVRRADAAEPGPGPVRRPACRSSAPASTRSKTPRTARSSNCLLRRLNLKQPANGIARNMSQARSEAAKVGFPSLVRPSFVLGGRAMEICYDDEQFEKFVAEAFIVAQGQPVLIDRFLEDATEVDVDAIGDGHRVIVAGIMEHIEEAGVHSGDSACAIPAVQPARPRRGGNPRRRPRRWRCICAWSG